MPGSLAPTGVGFPGSVFGFAAAGVDGEAVALEGEQIVLPGIGGDEFAGGSAEGSGADAIEFAAIGAHVVAVEAGFGCVNVAMEEEAKSSDGELFEEALIGDAIVPGAVERMVPDGDFEAGLVLV